MSIKRNHYYKVEYQVNVGIDLVWKDENTEVPNNDTMDCYEIYEIFTKSLPELQKYSVQTKYKCDIDDEHITTKSIILNLYLRGNAVITPGYPEVHTGIMEGSPGEPAEVEVVKLEGCPDYIAPYIDKTSIMTVDLKVNVLKYLQEHLSNKICDISSIYTFRKLNEQDWDETIWKQIEKQKEDY